jgi:hypothetical protein
MDRSVLCDEFDGNGNVWRGDACIIKNAPYQVVMSQEIHDVPTMRIPGLVLPKSFRAVALTCLSLNGTSKSTSDDR